MSSALFALRTWFLWDFLFMFPFAPIILTINPGYYDSATGLYIGLLGFLKLVSLSLKLVRKPKSMRVMIPRAQCDDPERPTYPPGLPHHSRGPTCQSPHTHIQGRLYDVFEMFRRLDFSMIFSQISLTIMRNVLYSMLSCHWFACMFYFIARVEYASTGSWDGTWVGRHYRRFDDQPEYNV